MKLLLKKPLKQTPLKISQKFGDNNLCIRISDNHIQGKPLTGCPAGYVSLYDEWAGMRGHNALDIACVMGELVYASHDGVITEIETEMSRGYGLAITSNDKYELEGGEYKIKTRYWHLLGWCVKMEQKVKAGEVIGVGDSTGISSGSHLHFELKPLKDDGTNLLQDNKMYGAIDPELFIEKEYLIPPITKDLYFGQKDQEVVYLKRKLNKLGYLSGVNYTNYFGIYTKEAVINFQKTNNLYWAYLIYKGKKVGASSRIKLNSL